MAHYSLETQTDPQCDKKDQASLINTGQSWEGWWV